MLYKNNFVTKKSSKLDELADYRSIVQLTVKRDNAYCSLEARCFAQFAYRCLDERDMPRFHEWILFAQRAEDEHEARTISPR